MFATGARTFVAHLGFLVALVALVGVGCTGDDDGLPTPGATETVVATSSVTPEATGTASGEPTAEPIATSAEFRQSELFAMLPDGVSEAISAALDRALPALRGHVDWQPQACAADGVGDPPSPPTCGSGEASGTMVDAVLFVQGEGQFVSWAGFLERFEFVFDRTRALCSVRAVEADRFVVVLRALVDANVSEVSFAVEGGLITSFGEQTQFPGEFGPCTAR